MPGLHLVAWPPPVKRSAPDRRRGYDDRDRDRGRSRSRDRRSRSRSPAKLKYNDRRDSRDRYDQKAWQGGSLTSPLLL